MKYPFALLVWIAASTASSPPENWNTPLEPFRIFGNTYYVGTAGLSAILIIGCGPHPD